MACSGSSSSSSSGSCTSDWSSSNSTSKVAMESFSQNKKKAKYKSSWHVHVPYTLSRRQNQAGCPEHGVWGGPGEAFALLVFVRPLVERVPWPILALLEKGEYQEPFDFCAPSTLPAHGTGRPPFHPLARPIFVLRFCSPCSSRQGRDWCRQGRRGQGRREQAWTGLAVRATPPTPLQGCPYVGYAQLSESS